MNAPPPPETESYAAAADAAAPAPVEADVVEAEDMARLPDKSVSESLQRVTRQFDG